MKSVMVIVVAELLHRRVVRPGHYRPGRPSGRCECGGQGGGSEDPQAGRGEARAALREDGRDHEEGVPRVAKSPTFLSV